MSSHLPGIHFRTCFAPPPRSTTLAEERPRIGDADVIDGLLRRTVDGLTAGCGVPARIVFGPGKRALPMTGRSVRLHTTAMSCWDLVGNLDPAGRAPIIYPGSGRPGTVIICMEPGSARNNTPVHFPQDLRLPKVSVCARGKKRFHPRDIRLGAM